MKLGCIALNFNLKIREKAMTHEDWLKMAVELGLDATEIYEPFLKGLDEKGIAKLAAMVRDIGLNVSMYTPETDFSRPQNREQSVKHCKQAVDRALIFGANIVRLTAVSPDQMNGLWYMRQSKEDVMLFCANGIRACLDYAEKKGVMLALEDHPMLGITTPDFVRLLEMVADDRLKVNLDTANVPGGEIVELTNLVGNRVVHTHISETLKNKHGFVIGKGDVDFKGVFQVLKNFGYDSWISLEALVGDKEDLKFSIKHIRNLWNSV
jgi:sugar phosphate isomerase/epimerase